jgi:plasmid stability protein
MPTIQVREIPEDVYEVIRKRARTAGRSIQSYMRDWIIDFAANPTTGEALAAMEAALEASDTNGATRESILADLAADRR